MKILFDQNVPAKLKGFLTKHEVTRARTLGWEELKNGSLLNAAEAHGFECLITCDRNLSYQQDLRARRIALVVLPSGNWPQVKLKLPEIISAVDSAAVNSFIEFAPVVPPKEPFRLK